MAAPEKLTKIVLPNEKGQHTPMWIGEDVLSAASTVALNIDIPGVQVGDIVLFSLKTDDTGAPITLLVGEVSAEDVLTFTQTSGTNVDGVVDFMVIRSR